MKSKHRVRIVDGEALRASLEEVYSSEGSNQKAANRLGIEKSTFIKLRKGTVFKAMSYETYSKILKALGGRPSELWFEPDGVVEFGGAPSDAELEREMKWTGKTAEEAEADLWAASDKKALVAFNLLEKFKNSVLTEDGRFVRATYDEWLRKEIKRLKPKARRLALVLVKHQAYVDLIRGFYKRVRGSRETPPPEDLRIALAVYRALEPLNAAEETWGVERSFHEMHEKGVFKDYLKAALKREEILMQRERDLDRIRESVPPMEYGSWLAMVEEDEPGQSGPGSAPP